MKKLICAILTLMMLFAALIPATAENALVGGWTANTAENPAEIPQEALDAFNKAIEGMVGCTYEPIALLATQVVAGTNYAFLCRLTVVYPDAVPTYALVYVYQNVEGECQLARVENIEFDIQEPVAE